MSTYVFYHSADLDGHCSAAIALDALDKECSNMKFFAINYGQDFPFEIIEKSDTVYMLDFSLQPFDKMLKLNDMCRLIWIDHHESAIKEAEKYADKLFLGNREIGKAACELTWKYFNDKELMPISIHLLGRYDVWDLKENVLEFQYGMRMHDTLDPRADVWEPILSNDKHFTEFTVQAGGIILKYKTQENYKYLTAYAFPVDFEGYKCLACNKGMSSSKLFASVDIDYDIYITFVRLKEGGWTISLYSSKEDINVGEIAKKHGGGGHSGAAGFQVDRLPF